MTEHTCTCGEALFLFLSNNRVEAYCPRCGAETEIDDPLTRRRLAAEQRERAGATVTPIDKKREAKAQMKKNTDKPNYVSRKAAR